MMPRLVFCDTETTGLSLDDDIWEIAMIMRDLDADGQSQEQELHLFVEHDPAKCARLPDTFRADHASRYPGACSGRTTTRAQAAYLVRHFTEGAHIVGAVPNFDTERLALLLDKHGHKPAWHYHLIDVENLAVGYLWGRAHDGAITGAVNLPWDSDWLAKQVGVETDEDARHTAMGDARWARDIWDAVTG